MDQAPVPIRCPARDDGRHEWVKIDDGVQSNELFECKHCHGRIWD